MSFKFNPAIAERRANNVAIFEEKMQICRDGFYVSATGKRRELTPTGDVLKASVFYRDPPRVAGVPTCAESKVDAVNADCIDVARGLVAEGFRPVMLNMANRHTPGGGVINGARAQEETLFRRSNLCVSLYQFSDYHSGLVCVPKGEGRYPMDRDTGGIYSGRVMFFRAGADAGDALIDDPFECAVVSAAALNRPPLDAEGRLVDWAIAATKRKIRTVLRIGLLHGHDAIVLGAWGCGAFCNPPRHIAELFGETIAESEFSNKYRRIRFAVIEDHNSRHANYAPFADRFNSL